MEAFGIVTLVLISSGASFVLGVLCGVFVNRALADEKPEPPRHRPF